MRLKGAFIVLLIFWVCGCFREEISEASIKKQFYSLQKEYFLKLDLRAPKSDLQTIPAFASRLSELAVRQKALLDTDKHLTKDDKEFAGLVLIYDAMFNVNVIIGLEARKLSLADFVNLGPNNASPNEQLEARAKFSVLELQHAAKLRPNDYRIAGWIAATKGEVERIHSGHISKSIEDGILQSIAKRPSFNLWTAILMLHNEPQFSKQPLVDAAMAFVQQESQGQSECMLHPDDCMSTWKAPYNLQASVTELGDVFLQQAEYDLARKRISKAMEMAEYAKGTYAVLSKPEHLELTQKWPDFDALALRMKRLTDVQNQKRAKEPLDKMSLYQRVYECSSCHGRLTLNLKKH